MVPHDMRLYRARQRRQVTDRSCSRPSSRVPTAQGTSERGRRGSRTDRSDRRRAGWDSARRRVCRSDSGRGSRSTAADGSSTRRRSSNSPWLSAGSRATPGSARKMRRGSRGAGSRAESKRQVAGARAGPRPGPEPPAPAAALPEPPRPVRRSDRATRRPSPARSKFSSRPNPPCRARRGGSSDSAVRIRNRHRAAAARTTTRSQLSRTPRLADTLRKVSLNCPAVQ